MARSRILYSRGVQPASASIQTAPARPGLPWAAIGLAFSALFAVSAIRTAFAVLYPAMVADLGWSVGQVTAAFSAGLLVYAPTALAIGLLVDRAGCRVTMLGGCACLAVGMALVAVATELWHLYVAFILAGGLGSAAVGFITAVKVVSLRAGRRFASAFALAYLGFGVGTLVAGPAVQGVLELAGWRGGALAVAVLVVVGLLPLVALLAPGRDAQPRAEAGAGTAPGRPAGGWAFAVFFVGNFMLGYLYLVPTHQVAHSLEAGFAPMTAATAAGLWGALGAIGGVAGGWALERWGSGRLVILGVLLFGAGTASLIVHTPEASWLLGLFIVGSGFGRGTLSLPLVAGQTRAFAGPRLGRLTGVLDLGYGSGAFLGPWLTGVVHDVAGNFNPGFVSAIAAAAMVAAATVLGSRLASARCSDKVPAPSATPGERLGE